MPITRNQNFTASPLGSVLYSPPPIAGWCNWQHASLWIWNLGFESLSRSSLLENPHTGEQIEFVVETSELLVIEAVWPRPGRRTGAHAHPGMEERWTVIEGRGAFRIGDAAVTEAGPGETVVAPPRTPHEAWNPQETPARVRIEMRPALRWREFVERLFSGREDPRALLAEFPDEIRLG